MSTMVHTILNTNYFYYYFLEIVICVVITLIFHLSCIHFFIFAHGKLDRKLMKHLTGYWFRHAANAGMSASPRLEVCCL